MALQDGDLVTQKQNLGGLPRPLAADSRNPATIRVIRKKTNRRHMIGDHHGQAASTATLLLTATDGVLGTHKAEAEANGAGQGE